MYVEFSISCIAEIDRKIIFRKTYTFLSITNYVHKDSIKSYTRVVYITRVLNLCFITGLNQILPVGTTFDTVFQWPCYMYLDLHVSVQLHLKIMNIFFGKYNVAWGKDNTKEIKIKVFKIGKGDETLFIFDLYIQISYNHIITYHNISNLANILSEDMGSFYLYNFLVMKSKFPDAMTTNSPLKIIVYIDPWYFFYPS